MQVVIDGTVFVDYGQAFLASGERDQEDFDVYFAGQVNGLCGTAVPGWVWLMTATHTGDVRIRVELHDGPPPLDDADEDVVEASWVHEGDDVMLCGLMGDPGGDFPLAPDTYRVRYSARGMDAASDAIEGLGPDSYVVRIWAAPAAPDRILRQTSERAAVWHGYRRGDSAPAPDPLVPVLETAPLPSRDRALVLGVREACAATGIADDDGVQSALEAIAVAAESEPGRSWLAMTDEAETRTPGALARSLAQAAIAPLERELSLAATEVGLDVTHPVYAPFSAVRSVQAMAFAAGVRDPGFYGMAEIVDLLELALGDQWPRVQALMLADVVD